LDGPLAKLCPAVALSRQDGRHSAVALLLKAALIQVSDYRLLGASGFQNNLTFVIQMLINVFPRIVFVRIFFLHISRESNNIYIVFV
jgi:hypothetical protein